MSRSRASTRRAVFLFLVVLAAGGEGFYWWWNSRTEVYTDNAYVVGNITPISANVTGQVVALYVDDNMIVEPGDPIAQINPVDFQIAVDQALAEYEQAGHAADAADVQASYTTGDRKAMLRAAEAKREEAEQMVEASRVMVQTQTSLHQKEKQVLAALQAQLPGLKALEDNAKKYYDRYKSLAQSGDVPGQEFDNREATYRDAIAKVQSLLSDIAAAERQVAASEQQLAESRVRLVQSQKTLDNTEGNVGRAEAEQMQLTVAADTALALRNQVGLAEAKLRQARLDLSNTLIRAPRAGVISRRTIQVGTTVEAHEPFLSIVPLDFGNVWIVANLREKQMPNVRVGQAVSITVDAIEGRKFKGWVESVAGGSGSVFSLFPPDNATGNFVRVVQRLPVRIRFAEPENYQNRVRPGMSTRITIDTTRYVRNSTQEW